AEERTEPQRAVHLARGIPPRRHRSPSRDHAYAPGPGRSRPQSGERVVRDLAGSAQAERLRHPAKPQPIRGEIDARQSERARGDLLGGKRRTFERLSHRRAQGGPRRLDADHLPVRRTALSGTKDRAGGIDHEGVTSVAVAVDAQHGPLAHPPAPLADAYASSTTRMTTRPSSPFGLGSRPCAIASRNSATCAVYMGWEVCS